MVTQLESLRQPDAVLTTESESALELPSTPSAVYMDVNVVPVLDEEGGGGLLSTISSLEADMLQLRSKQFYLDALRKEALDKMLDIKGSIRVFCRVRPVEGRKRKSRISIEQEKITVRSVAGGQKEFNVDRVFLEDSTQEEVFAEVQPILRSALDGHNVCIFAYGQTGAGKTFTMQGTSERPGIVPRAIQEIFHQVSLDKSATFTLSISMLEVYMGNLRDLLAQRPSRNFYCVPKCNLNILSGSNGSIEIEGLRDVQVGNYEQANKWYAKGKRVRSTSWTNVNEASSRSHCLTRITITRSGDLLEGNRVISKVWLVDLGGSERLMKTGATGVTLDEGRAINLSLSALGDVIAALKMRRNHIPYRNSKLTQILTDSLGHGSKVLMIAHISPDVDDVGETICSLSFAKRVRAVEATRELSEDLKKQKQQSLAELNGQIHDAEEELKRVRKQIERAEDLIQEKTKILRDAYQLPDGQKGSPRSPLVLNHVEVMESPRITEKSNNRAHSSSVPHFMASTMSSRQRQNAAESIGKPKVGSRKPIDSLRSQSFSFSPRGYLRPNSSSSKRKKIMPEADFSKKKDCTSERNAVNVSQDSISSKPICPLRHREAGISHPNSRVRLHQHKRRMSDLT